MFSIPGVREEPPLRINNKRVHLTFAALYAGELQFDGLLTTAQGWADRRGGLLEYAIGREKHTQPADPQRDEHFHIYLRFGKAVDVADRLHTNVFDLRGRGGRPLHPELQSIGSSAADRERVIRYDIKDGDYVAEIVPKLAWDPKRDEPSQEEEDDDDRGCEEDTEPEKKTPKWAKMLNESTTVTQGLELLKSTAPQVYYLHGSKIEPMLAKSIANAPPTQLFSMDDFNKPPLDLNLPTVLYGDTETGAARPPTPTARSPASPAATTHARTSSPIACRPPAAGKTAYAKAHFKNPLVVRRKDDLKRISGVCDGIIFDDVDLSTWSPEDTICLLDWDETRSLPARYSDAQLEADIPLIFTTNKKPKYMFVKAHGRQKAAIKRRYTCVEITAPLMALGRPLSPIEKRARKEAGRDGPKGPGV